MKNHLYGLEKVAFNLFGMFGKAATGKTPWYKPTMGKVSLGMNALGVSSMSKDNARRLNTPYNIGYGPNSVA